MGIKTIEHIGTDEKVAGTNIIEKIRKVTQLEERD